MRLLGQRHHARQVRQLRLARERVARHHVVQRRAGGRLRGKAHRLRAPAGRPAGSPSGRPAGRLALRGPFFLSGARLGLPRAPASLGPSQPLGPRRPASHGPACFLDRAAHLLASHGVVGALPDVEGRARALRPGVRRALRPSDGRVRVLRGTPLWRRALAKRQIMLRDARAWRDAAGRRLTGRPAVLHECAARLLLRGTGPHQKADRARLH